MTVKELKKFFKDHLVPSHLYNMKGGHHRNRICIANDKNGWQVYFSEGKEKIGLMQLSQTHKSAHIHQPVYIRAFHMHNDSDSPDTQAVMRPCPPAAPVDQAMRLS